MMATGLEAGQGETVSETPLTAGLQKSIAAAVEQFDQIPDDRRALLEQIAEFAADRLRAGGEVRLTFICTHNSRRSHMCQLWAAAAAAHYRIPRVTTYSGGTEATAFNPRAVDSLRQAGFQIEVERAGSNPRYLVRVAEQGVPLVCYSKVYSDRPNPESDFCAVMTCSEADEACPVVMGAAQRVALPYVDPKVADGTPLEAATYHERSCQIAREMLFVFSRVSARTAGL
jgi:protein-tyrosine-phosphatase